MTRTEFRSVTAIACVYALRMLGLAMVMPVFMLMATNLKGYTVSLAGMAIGAYGLSQALLQIPYGMLSDRYGRKPLIFIGLVIFGLGSLIATFSNSIYGVILGRFFQGAGAVAGVLMALVSDVTSEENRTKAMATIGIGIGISFSLSLVLGPLLGHFLGLAGIFGVTAILAAIGILVLIFIVPTPPEHKLHRDTGAVAGQLKSVLRDTHLLWLDYGVMTLHVVLVAFFVTVPSILHNQLGIEKPHHAWVYLSVVIPAFFAMVPFIIIGEKRHKMKEVLAGAVTLMALSMALMAIWQRTFVAVWFFIFMFFMAFNLLEATLPSLVSKECRAGSKGTAIGIYSTCQFLGAFIGGAVGGFILQHWGSVTELWAMAIVLLAWLAVIISMPQPSYSTSFELQLRDFDVGRIQEIQNLLSAVPGVEEVTIAVEEKKAYLKVDSKILDKKALDKIR